MNPLAMAAVEAAKHVKATIKDAERYPGAVTGTSTGADGTSLATVLRKGSGAPITVPTLVSVVAGDSVLIEYRPSGAVYIVGVI